MGKLIFLCGNIVDDEILKLGDAIVLPTNPMMRFGSGVSGAIFKKAGIDLLENYTETTFGISYYNEPGTNEMVVGETRVTPGFHLPCEIIFAQGPKAYEYPDFPKALGLLLQTYKNTLNTAVERRYKSILLPALGTGSYGFTHESTAKSVAALLSDFVKSHEIDVYFVVYDPEKLNMYQ